MSFDFLDQRIIDALRKNGIEEPTEPQKDAIPRISKGENILLVAPTGIGKTEAAVLPIFDAILKTKNKPGIRCIYVTPLRALNRDMLKRMEDYGRELGISVSVRHGDTPQPERNKQSAHPPDILITTPETMQVLFTGKNLLRHLKHVEWFIVDEVHELATTERGAQLSVAMERLALIAGDFQRIGLSATVGDVDEVARFLAGMGREMIICKHDTFREYEINVECPQACDDATLLDKLQCDPNMLGVMLRAKNLIDDGKSTLFFVNTRETAEWLAARYHAMDENISIDVHHGSLSKDNRMEMEDRFKRGSIKALVCTSSLELGIDVGTTDLVIQFNSPRQVSRMIQRAGRAGHRVGELIRAKIIATLPDEVAESLVIARKTDTKELENKKGRKCPLTVVANQLISMTMSKRMTRDEAFAVFTKSYSFAELRREDMDAVLDQLKSIKMVFEDPEGFRRSKKGMIYFYNNISMIPDEKTYLIREIASRSIIGTLDESFVVSFAEPYAMFIANGRTWRIIEIKEDELLVEEAKDMGSVPSWTGSDIPVPYEVAMEVGKMRRLRNLDDYPGDENSKKCITEYLDRQTGYKMPTDETVTVEYGNRMVIVNACFGTCVNETLGKMYAGLLTARFGASVGVSTDPYRINLELPEDEDPKVIMETLTSIVPGSVEKLIRCSISNSSFLRWRFVYVAKKFGIIEKGADTTHINFGKLFDIHKDTPAYEEAVNKVMWEDLDIENTEKAVKLIYDGKIKMVLSKLSPIGIEGLSRSKEMMLPERATHAILMALKKRLGDEVLYASCLNCQSQWRVRVSNAPKHFVCQKCGGRMVAPLKEYDRDKIKLMSKKELTDQDKKDINRLKKIASLSRNDSQAACMALSGRGVGPDAAARILNGKYNTEDAFLRKILTAETQYAKNKRFWD